MASEGVGGYRFAAVELDIDSRELWVDGEKVALEMRPLGVLEVLLAHAGEVVTKQELHEVVWDGRPTVDNVLPNAVAKLRKVLGADLSPLIETLPRVGYRLNAVVERLPAHTRLDKLAFSAGMAVPRRPHFRLVEPLGTRTDGEVWLARHVKTAQKRVFKFSLSGRRLTAFKREVTLSRYLEQSLSSADSAHFAVVEDWSFDEAPFYLESAYGGPNLEQWEEQTQALQTMSDAERIQLFLQIAQAVASAHQVGVLHKDLKPSNVLVDQQDDGSLLVKLVDFGSARLQNVTDLDALGVTRMGFTETSESSSSGVTPLYVAPELIAGESPTVQSDIYALGIMLYQMLAGDLHKPMVTGWEADVPNELLREDLAAATAGGRDNRLGSVAELIHRLRRLKTRREHRARELEAAETLHQNQQALARSRARRPWVVASFVAVVLGLIGTGTLYQQEERARQRAEHILQFWNDEMVRAGDPHSSGSPTLAEALDAVGDHVPQRFADDPSTRAALHLALGNMYLGQTRQQRAIEHLQQAADLYANLHPASSVEVLSARIQLAMAMLIASKLDQGEERLNEVLQAVPKLDRLPLSLQAKVHYSRGVLTQRRDNWVAARDHFALGLQTLERLPERPWREWYKTANLLVDCYRHTAEPDKAMALLEAMLAPEVDPVLVGRGRMATARLQRGHMLGDLGRYAEAEAAVRAAVPELVEVYGEGHFSALVAQADLASLSLKTKRWSQAQKYAQVAHDGIAKRLGEAHLVTYKVGTLLGATYLYPGQAQRDPAQLQRAEEVFQQILAGMQAVAGEDSPSTHAPRYFYAVTLALTERFSEAEKLADGIQVEAMRGDLPAEDWELKLPAFQQIIHWYTRPEQRDLKAMQALANQLPHEEHPLLRALLDVIVTKKPGADAPGSMPSL